MSHTTYKIKLVASAIVTLALIATITICLRTYWYRHSIMQQWGSTLVLVNMFFDMAVIIVALTLMN
jgi:hypothetical protein